MSGLAPLPHRRLSHWLISLLVLAMLGAVVLSPRPSLAVEAQQNDSRFFPETGYRIDRDAFWDYFQKRGGLETFGYPISREFTFFTCPTQLFQRIVMQQCGTEGVSTMNLLEAGLLPYNVINGSTFPAHDPEIVSRAPSPLDPDYASKVVEFLRVAAPNEFEGEPVSFFDTFMSTVTLEDAFPDGGGDEGLLPLLNLEIWGIPTSRPTRDPNNHNFIYLRFQRGIMHYDATTGLTQGLLLADYLKSIITGLNLPPDLAEQALNSPLYLAALSEFPPLGTNLAGAFIDWLLGLAPATPTPRPILSATHAPLPAANVQSSATSPDYGISMFIWGQHSTTSRDLNLAQDAGFRWQKTLFQWRLIEGRCKGCFDWTEADRIVQASNAAGIKIIARIDFQPGWTGVPEHLNGPPLNYQDFYDFITAFTSRYKEGSPHGRVHAIEVWNEVNLDREWGMRTINRQQAADYVRLLGGAYNAAKSIDPNMIIVTAGLSPTGVTNGKSADDLEYLGWMYEAGMRGKFDVLGAHGNTQAPEVDAELNSIPGFTHPSFYFRRVEQLRDVMVRNGDAHKQVWLLEFGWTSDTLHEAYAWFAVSEEKKAQNLVRAYQFARERWSPWMGVMVLWTMSDPFWTPQREEYWWAITNPDGGLRPAYHAIRDARNRGILP